MGFLSRAHDTAGSSVATPVESDPSPDRLIEQAAEAESDGRYVDAIDLLQRANRLRADPEIEVHLVGLRDRGFGAPARRAPGPRGRRATRTSPPMPTACPRSTASELSEATLGSGIVNHGALLVRGLLDADQVAGAVVDIDQAFAAYDEWEVDGPIGRRRSWRPWFVRYRPANGYPESKLPRPRPDSGGVWMADSPRVHVRAGRAVRAQGHSTGSIAAYLGERPALSVKKCTLRRVPIDCGTDWHQDGAFLGDDIRTVNVWIALTDCGGPDSDVPGLDLVPQPVRRLLETGTEGAPCRLVRRPRSGRAPRPRGRGPAARSSRPATPCCSTTSSCTDRPSARR